MNPRGNFRRRHVISCHRKLSEHHRHGSAWITPDRHQSTCFVALL
ncbi:hypothetical protein CGMCC3_g6188 [Colletotrichum fructicola]|nr:uncharacterized protein CGMCC3_g6188 [Colletotrichum fructicola]KAE9577890.1 hypothetical protein CGMCC3_g6188 [Colletotrichum fructicola]